jgi:hypothetical protein
MQGRFCNKLNAEILIVLEEIGNVRKENQREMSKLSSNIDEIYVNVNEKVEADVSKVKEYMVEKFRVVAKVMQLSKKMPKTLLR